MIISTISGSSASSYLLLWHREKKWIWNLRTVSVPTEQLPLSEQLLQMVDALLPDDEDVDSEMSQDSKDSESLF
jgi:hypothetical protein